MRVVVAEDTVLTRQGIVALLTSAGLDVVGEVADAESLLREVAATTPDVVVVDIRMPPTHTTEGLVAAERLAAEHPSVGVLVLSQYVEPSYALRLITDRPERVGYLLKERVVEAAELVDALQRINAGETVVDPAIVSQLLNRPRVADPLETLTDREREVLALVAQGLSNASISSRLYVTERTVEAHVTSTFSKLGLTDGPTSNRRVLATLTFLRSNGERD